MKKFTAILVVLASISTLAARQEQRSCASHAGKWREELQLHQQSSSALRAKQAFGKSAVSVQPDLGDIAHLDDADGVVARRNPFNLNGQTIRFRPSPDASKYRVEVAAGTYDQSAAEAGALVAGLADDDSRELILPFAFPFFGVQHRSFYLNSDGNISFGGGDADITDRSLGRFLSGPARIAPLFRDLDPTRASTGIKVLNESNRTVISWVNVPEYQDSGVGPLQTFQLRLYSDGKIEIAYSDVKTTDAVTGITPGGLQGDPSLVSFLNGAAGAEYTSSVAERFSGTESVDIFAAAQKFYRNHQDSYDYLVIYNTMDIAADTSAVAYEVTVRNSRSGYGDTKIDVGTQAGSQKRLQAILNMGPLSQYPKDPNAKVQARLSVGDTPLTVVAHEAGHLFLAYASVEDQDGNRPMLGYQSAHWNFLFNSEASLLEGNRIKDNGAGASPRFQTTAAVEGYSPLDQYLMGLRPPEDVPATFYVDHAVGARTTGLPRVGATFDGVRRDVTVQDVIAEVGRRTPDSTVSQRRFRFAFLVITPNGTSPTADQLAQVEAYRTQFESFFPKAASQNATADTLLKKAVSLSAFPAVGVTQGGTVPIRIALEDAAAVPTTFLARAAAGSVQAPESVTIPAGSREGTFNITGLSEGTDEIRVESPDSAYESITARVQVLPTSKLKLSVLSPSSPIRIKVTDANELPYPGVPVQAQVTSGGSLDRSLASSDANGVVEFVWTQRTDGDNQLVAGVASGPSITITAGAPPVFAAGSVLNAASYVPGLVPGGIATIFGTRLGGQNARVLINGQTAQLLFGDDSQLNFVAPAGIPAGTADVIVQSANTASAIVQAPVLAAQPGIFFDATTGLGAIRQSDGYLEIYATGLGDLSTRPVVTLAGRPAEVTFSGLAPGFTGLYQVNVRIPAGTPSGTQSLALTLEGVRSNEVKVQAP
jgi:uncharacterized protein (TIGR03437 family)